MIKRELSTKPDFTSFGDQDKVFGKNATGGFGFYPSSMITRKGYACRRWDMSASTPVGEAYGNIDYLRDIPSLLGLGCYLVGSNRSRRKLDPTNHYKFADGSPAALDGTMGHYMWCWNKFYYAWWIEGGYYYEAVSMNPIIGKYNYVIAEGGTSAIGHGVVDRLNNKLVSYINSDAQFRGGDNDAAKDGTYRTFLGRAASKLSSIEFGTLARANGEGWEANWYVHRAVVGLLTRIIMGTRHIQAPYNATKDANGLYQGGFGPGVTGFTNWTALFEQFPFLPTSVGVNLGDSCGVSSFNVLDDSDATVYTANIPCFFGLKDFYGDLYQPLRGMLLNKIANGGADVYVAGSMFDPFNAASIAGLIKASVIPPNSVPGSEFITSLSMQNLCAMPTAVGGSESTYYADAIYNDNAVSGLRCPFVGGYALFGGAAGVSSVLAHNSPSTAIAYGSAPLCYLVDDVSPVPTLML